MARSLRSLCLLNRSHKRHTLTRLTRSARTTLVAFAFLRFRALCLTRFTITKSAKVFCFLFVMFCDYILLLIFNILDRYFRIL